MLKLKRREFDFLYLVGCVLIASQYMNFFIYLGLSKFYITQYLVYIPELYGVWQVF